MKMNMMRKGFLAGLSAVSVTGWSRLFAESRPFGAGARVQTGRIQRFLARVLAADVRPVPVKVKYDPADLALPEPVRIGKRLKEYVSSQLVTLRADEELVGRLSFDGSVESDLFPHVGHKAFRAACGKYYCKPQAALATFEWQHSSIDYPKLLKGGLVRIRAEIKASKRPRLGLLRLLRPPQEDDAGRDHRAHGRGGEVTRGATWTN